MSTSRSIPGRGWQSRPNKGGLGGTALSLRTHWGRARALQPGTPHRRYLLTPSLLFVLSLGGPSAVAQTGEFDLEKTKTVLSGLIEDALRDDGVPSISIALVRGDEIVWKAAFGYANVLVAVPFFARKQPSHRPRDRGNG